jgi:hypothetical protein
MHEVWHWILNFTGVSNGDNSFGTHMYNFWSGFGGNISVLALIGTLIALYKRSSKKLQKLQVLNSLNPLNLVHSNEKDPPSSKNSNPTK